jgi:two-component system LytT family sensor kinase
VKESLLVNALGHSAGVLIFGIFLFLLIQDRTARRPGVGFKSIVAAGLALAWNLASLIVLGTGDATGPWINLTVAVSFSVLSLLPAVLFDLSLEGRHRPLMRLGYALSGVSVALHLAELISPGDVYHRVSLILITVGFGLLTLIAAISDRGTSRLIATMSLFLLAMSFVHLGSGHAQQIWSQELAFHHAAIPLALLVLLQDYRFMLLDAFLRFLANVFLAALLVTGVAIAWSYGLLPQADTPFHQALLLAGACLLLVVFALLRSQVQHILTRVLFGRMDDKALVRALQMPVRNEEAYFAAAARKIGEFMGSDAYCSTAAADEGAGVSIPLRLPSEGRYLILGRRSGGRRYLSEDLQALNHAASVMVEQVERFRESEMRRLVAQAELQALQSQIHPHFLFNALNALYGIIPRDARGARDTVLNLADIFRYFLETRKTHVPLEEEMRIVRAYLDVERLRLGDKLVTEFAIAPGALHVPIPILSVQPLVENAIKHGVAPQASGGVVRVEARVDSGGGLAVAVRDSGRGFADVTRNGVGLENVRRRLALGFGGEARLEISSSPAGSEVTLWIPAGAVRTAEAAR